MTGIEHNEIISARKQANRVKKNLKYPGCRGIELKYSLPHWHRGKKLEERGWGWAVFLWSSTLSLFKILCAPTSSSIYCVPSSDYFDLPTLVAWRAGDLVNLHTTKNTLCAIFTHSWNRQGFFGGSVVVKKDIPFAF